MVLDNDHIQDNVGYPVKTPGPIGASLAWQPASGRRLLAEHTGNPRDDDGTEEREGGDHPPQDNPLSEGQGGAGELPEGGGEAV